MIKQTDDQLLVATKKLIAIESTASEPDALREALDFMTQRVTASGKDITIEYFQKNGVPSFIAYKGLRRPDRFTIILNAHIDVVAGTSDQYKAAVRDGKLYGRGAYDMKAAAIIMADAFCQYVDTVPYTLGLQIVTDEEDAGNNGTAYQIEQGVRADFVICGECGRAPGTFEIANESKGLAVVELEFIGQSAHGAYLWRGENAILRATEYAHKILQKYPIPTQETQRTTVNISSIATKNTAYSKVPDHASLRLDIRFESEDKHFKSINSLTNYLKSIDATAKIAAVHTFMAPIYTNPKNPLLIALKTAAEEVEKHAFELVRRHGTSDGRHYTSVGDEACEFGIAGDHHHADGEYITIDAFKKYRRTIDTFLAKTIKTM